MPELVRVGLAWCSCCVAVLAAGAPCADGASILVHPDGSGDFPTIQAAVDASVSGDEIMLTDGVFAGPGNSDVVVFAKTVHIRSRSGSAPSCIVDCGGWGQGLRYLAASGAVLDGITITGGVIVEGMGGALDVTSSSLTVRSCVFRENEAWEAGAVFCQWSTVTIEDCVLAHNTATLLGGGALFASEATVNISRCSFIGNTAARGSAIEGYNEVTFNVDHSIFYGNGPSAIVNCLQQTTAVFSCTDVYGNAAGDWIGCLEGQGSLRSNFSADPGFCGAEDYTIRANSPCAPPGLTGCGQVGALPVACGASGIEPLSWGRVKALFGP